MQLEDWLDDLCVRFIVNIPAEELAQIERICFQIEEAQWFYEDFIRPLDPSLPSLSLKPFFSRITQRCPIFQHWPSEELANAFERFLKYKNRVPVRGAILLNDKMDQVLLVKGWKKAATWSFPRGKINKGEDDLDCAIREAWEETGFDIRAAGLVPDAVKIKHIERTLRSQNMKLFIFRGVPYDAQFVPQTRKEISKVQWFKLADLPTEKRRNQQEGNGQHLVLNANKFYVVAPFMTDLRKHINTMRRKDNRNSSRLAAPPMTNDTPAQHYAASTEYPAMPMSPPLPSSLPEVASISMHEPHQHEIQTGIATPASTNPILASASAQPSKYSLLALLQKGRPAEMAGDSHTLLDQHTNLIQSPLPERPSYPSHHTAANTQPPITSYDLYPAAPPSSALPQLKDHQRSLLSAFTRPASSSTAQMDAKQSLPDTKQNLLAAFASTPTPTTNGSQTVPTPNPVNSLLQLLQGKQSITSPTAATVQLKDATNFTAFDQPVTKSDLPTSQPRSVESSTVTPFTNPLLGLLQQQQQQPAAFSSPASEPSAPPSKDTANSMTSPKHHGTVREQTEVAELSAISDHKPKIPNVDKTKTDLLSLLASPPPVDPKSTASKSRIGTTSATLGGPIDEPQFDAIAKAPTFVDEIKREPITSDRKLFNPRHDGPRQSPAIKVVARQDDRSRPPPKSPRIIKPKQIHSPRRPGTPKEPSKPFQPQILRRPQTSDGDSGVEPLSLPTEIAAVTQDSRSTTVLARQPSEAHEPLSSNLEASRVDSPGPPADKSLPSFARQPSTAQDPQREALLSLLKTPAPRQTALDTNLTPAPAPAPAPSGSVHAFQTSRESIVSPPTPGQLVSPVMENEHEQHTSRSRVSSLASIGNSLPGGRTHVERKQTAAGDKAFLMNYLKGFASQETA